MIIFAVTFLAFLILIQIPVLRQLTFAIVIISILSFLIAWGVFYDKAKTEMESKQGIRR